jgi:hypothetical protein
MNEGERQRAHNDGESECYFYWRLAAQARGQPSGYG